jgi:hypothetical protein
MCRYSDLHNHSVSILGLTKHARHVDMIPCSGRVANLLLSKAWFDWKRRTTQHNNKQ